MDITSCDYVSKCINSIGLKLGVHGYVRADSEWKSTGMSIPYSKLYFVFGGSADVSCGGINTELAADGVYLIPFGAYHSFYCEGEMEKLYFHFTLSKPSGCDMLENVNRIMRLDITREKLEYIKELYFSGDIFSCLELKNILYSTVLEFINRFKIRISPEPMYSDTVSAAIGYIRSRLSQRICVKELAEELFVSESMLSKRFSREVGMSIGKYIDREVMREAQRRLLISDDPIQLISESLGFCDQFYFSGKFKRFCGVPPIKYRKQNRDGI